MQRGFPVATKAAASASEDMLTLYAMLVATLNLMHCILMVPVHVAGTFCMRILTQLSSF